MFVNTAAFKRLIKNAYNTTGLTVGADEDEYFFSYEGIWVIRVEKDFFPKKEKAAVIELAGELPADGEVFKAVKKCDNQYLISGNPAWDIGTQFKEAKMKFNVTKAVYDLDEQELRVLQYKENNACIAIDEVFIGLIDTKAIDSEEETMIEGPYANNGVVYWGNNIMTMAAGVIAPEEESPLNEYLSLLSNIELPKKEMIY